MLHDTLDRLLTPKDLATYLQVSRAAISQWCRRGDLPFFQLGKSIRFEPVAIREWLKARERAARGGQP